MDQAKKREEKGSKEIEKGKLGKRGGYPPCLTKTESTKMHAVIEHLVDSRQLVKSGKGEERGFGSDEKRRSCLSSQRVRMEGWKGERQHVWLGVDVSV